MARPLGEIARAALSLLEEEQLTARQMAERLRVPERTIKDTFYNLKATGRVGVVDREKGNARRPVAVYTARQADACSLEAIWG
ncbi:helix-turn-helix domain-containing protein [Paracandidimonas soli]|uniref:Sugar-specific transcriptional regulator TrmB n=1 Tax=Paracandidimonas soli TaxID=1917182 RepID=A0A4R3UTD0_9BURK|nr:helix-turn-helix domain-containing protein [Paracandidimonas soli]TCU93933.1 sugar-specific transcriptional regulator TrmB [Paracandidimonas soli]